MTCAVTGPWWKGRSRPAGSPPPSGPRRPRSPSSRSGLGLDAVDDLTRARERLAAMGRRHRHDHAGVRARHVADPVLMRRRAQSVPLDRVGGDRGHALLGHLRVGLVLEALDLARHAGERDRRPGARIAHALGQRVQRQRLTLTLAHGAPPLTGGIRASSSPAPSTCSSDAYSRLTAITSGIPSASSDSASSASAHARALGQLERDRAGADTLAQHSRTDGRLPSQEMLRLTEPLADRPAGAVERLVAAVQREGGVGAVQQRVDLERELVGVCAEATSPRACASRSSRQATAPRRPSGRAACRSRGRRASRPPRPRRRRSGRPGTRVPVE